MVVLPLDLYWNDIGSWDSLYDVLDKDEEKNVKQGDVLAIDTRGTLIFGNKRQITTIGIEDCLIVETDDAILVAKKGEAQKVKEAVDSLHKAAGPRSRSTLPPIGPGAAIPFLKTDLATR